MELDNDDADAGDSREKRDDGEKEIGDPEKKKQKEHGTSCSRPPQKSSEENGKQVVVVVEGELASVDEEHDMLKSSKYPSSYSHLESHIGNFNFNFSQEIRDWVISTIFSENDPFSLHSSSVVGMYQNSEQPGMSHQFIGGLDMNGVGASMLAELKQTTPSSLGRSKRRQQSVDDHSLELAEFFKVKKNLDTSGMVNSKSFLSFSDSQIASNINRLGVSLGVDVSKGIKNIKKVECDRLVPPPQKEQSENVPHVFLGDDASYNDSDIGLDHQAIMRLVGSVADDTLGKDRGHWSDFKTVPRKNKSNSKKKNRTNKKTGRNHLNLSK